MFFSWTFHLTLSDDSDILLSRIFAALKLRFQTLNLREFPFRQTWLFNLRRIFNGSSTNRHFVRTKSENRRNSFTVLKIVRPSVYGQCLYQCQKQGYAKVSFSVSVAFGVITTSMSVPGSAYCSVNVCVDDGVKVTGKSN